jgi:hypothetical protein
LRCHRGDAAPLVRDLVGGWHSGRFAEVLAGDFDLMAASRSR